MKKFNFMALACVLSFTFSPLYSSPILAQDTFPHEENEDATKTLLADVNFIDWETGRIIHTKKNVPRKDGILISPDFYMFDLPEGYCFISKPSKIFISEADRDKKHVVVEVPIGWEWELGINSKDILESTNFDPSLPIAVKYPSSTLDEETKMPLQQVIFMSSKDLWQTDPITKQPMLVEEELNPSFKEYPIDVPLLWKDNFNVALYKDGENVEIAFYTTRLSVAGYVPGFPNPDLPQGQQPVFRFYNQETGEHFYSLNQVTRKILGEQTNWKAEGYPFAVPTFSSISIYRLKNPNNLDHHYTTDKNEYLSLQDMGWIGQGIAMYGADPNDSKAIPLYRLYNPNVETAIHHYTSSLNEHNTLISKGWKAEDIGWYVYSIDE